MDQVLREVAKDFRQKNVSYQPWVLAAVALWAAVHDRTVSWACQRLLGLLDKPELRQVALWKGEGWTTEEIAAKLGCVPRTVEGRLSRIRMLWRDELKELQA